MKVLKDFVKSLDNNKDPGLRYQYANGIGDLIACTLHSKYIGRLTHKITGSNSPCQKCSKRAQALNELFPIPIWKMFFNSENERDESFLKSLKEAGYIVETDSPGSISATKITETPITSNQEDLPTQNVSMPDKDYTLMSSGDNYIGEFLIRTLIYKQK
jgi:hypothetical protein